MRGRSRRPGKTHHHHGKEALPEPAPMPPAPSEGLPCPLSLGVTFLTGSLTAMLWGPPTSRHRGGAWLGRGPLLTQEAVAPPMRGQRCGVWAGDLSQAASNPSEMRQVLVIMRETGSCHLCPSGLPSAGFAVPSAKSSLTSRCHPHVLCWVRLPLGSVFCLLPPPRPCIPGMTPETPHERVLSSFLHNRGLPKVGSDMWPDPEPLFSPSWRPHWLHFRDPSPFTRSDIPFVQEKT